MLGRYDTAPTRTVAKFRYDVAVSFSGDDRVVAREMAAECKSRGLRVFYDEYERADLWGKDLAIHLDTIYRKMAKYCIILVSSAYATNVWTDHELRSALSRSLVEHEEYILPVRLDGTDLPGLRPTTGYLRLESAEDLRTVVNHLMSKLQARSAPVKTEFTPKWFENILEINRKWDLSCLAFCVDPRFAVDSEGAECRMGISYGINLTSPRVGFLAPSEQIGKKVFGLHCVAVVDHTKLYLWDQWIESLRADDYGSLEDAVQAASAHLAHLDDRRYYLMASHSETVHGLHLSDRYLLDEFEISTEVG